PVERPSARLSDCLDQVPLAHLGAAGDALPLGHLVELLAGPVLVLVSRLSASKPGLRSLTAEIPSGLEGQLRDRSLGPRGALGPLDVASCGLALFGRCHLASPPKRALV